ncbi:MAG: intracellular sulfur oxidation DsrE/DsrF family protein [Halieaceae bacterium]|jgi:intracellular sulfur oxidation DsrE/DsrF family protein
MLKHLLFAILFSFTISSYAGIGGFNKGPVFPDYGENVRVENGLEHPKLQHFKVVFDISAGADEGEVNGQFNTVARFINMHVRAGVPLDNIDVAMVIHGKAGLDLLSKSNTELVGLLLGENVQIILCGQSASYMGIEKSDLPDGVKISLSAMTANALLQQRGYTLNPF